VQRSYNVPDKPNAEYYSDQTVTQACASVALSCGEEAADVRDRVAQLSTHQGEPLSFANATI
jgi:hypothetical protein